MSVKLGLEPSLDFEDQEASSPEELLYYAYYYYEYDDTGNITDSFVRYKLAPNQSVEDVGLGPGLGNASCVNINDYLQSTGDLTTVGWVRGLFIVLYSLVFICGLGGNVFVVSAVARYKGLQTVRNIFIVGLSASDLAAAFTSVLLTPIIALVKEWHLGGAMCKLIPLCQGMSLCFSTLTLASIAIDRYILLVHPTRAALRRPHAIAILLLNAALSAAAALPVSLHQEMKSFRSLGICGSFCMESWSEKAKSLRVAYGLVLSLLSYVAPLGVIGFCYASIASALHARTQAKISNRSSASLSKAGEASEAQTKTQSLLVRRQQRTNRMLVSMVVIFAACWLAFILQNAVRDLGFLPRVMAENETFTQLCTHVLAVTSTVWNPLLYAYMNDQFRIAFIDLVSPFCPKSRAAAASSVGDTGKSLLYRQPKPSTLAPEACLVRGPLLGSASSLRSVASQGPKRPSPIFTSSSLRIPSPSGGHQRPTFCLLSSEDEESKVTIRYADQASPEEGRNFLPVSATTSLPSSTPV